MSRSSERVLVGTLFMFAALGSVSSARQTSTTTEARTFEVVAVNGNALVVREPSGTKEYSRSRHIPVHHRWEVAVGS